MKNIKEIEIEGERIYLKKNSFLGWGVINPIQKNIHEKLSLANLNWKNLLIGGNWFRFITILAIIILILLSIFEYSNAVQTANDCLQNVSLSKIDVTQWIPN